MPSSPCGALGDDAVLRGSVISCLMRSGVEEEEEIPAIKAVTT